MKKLISMPMTAGTLAEYPPTRSLEAACRHFDCDGLEVIWGGKTCRRISRSISMWDTI